MSEGDKKIAVNQNPPIFSSEWLNSIRPDGQSRHHLRDDYTYGGYLALYRFASTFCHDRRIAEIGCGCGYGSYLLAHFARQMVALDIDCKDILWASQRYRKDNLFFFAADALRTGLPDDCFDVVVALEIFEHIPQQQAAAFLGELERILSPSGYLILSTPNKTIYDKISMSAGHHNEMTVRQWFALLSSIFPQHQPFYQRKGEWQQQQRFYRWAGNNSRQLRRFLPPVLKKYLKKKLAPQRQKSLEELLIDLQVFPAQNLEELEDAVIQIAVCRKGKKPT